MKQKLFSLLFAIVASIGAMFAWDYEHVKIGDLYYNFDATNQTAEVTSNPDLYMGDIIIPSSVEYNEVTYSVTSIGRIAFYGCSSLTSITIPNSIISIGNQAFEDCQSLTSIFIPSSVASIGENAFPWGIRRNEMSVDITNPYYDSRDNCNAIIETATNKLIAGCNSTIIPSSVTIIASGAFDGCYELASVTIPAGVTQIEGRGFAYCTSLKSINIPASVVSIGYFAFDGCSGLTSITVDENNPNYDSRDNCNALIETASNTLIAGCKNTIIPNGISKIEIAAFEDCYGMRSIDIPNSVTYIGNGAFQECRSLASLIIPNSVTAIGSYTFADCYALEEIVLSNKIAKIESGLFYECINLSSIVIPGSVNRIDDKAFYYCKNLTQIVCENVFPPEIAGENVFYEVDKSIPLYVPSQSVEAYRAADGWKEFTNIQPICPIASGTCGDNLTWELSCDSVLTISGTGEMGERTWGDYNEQIKEVVIEDGVTSIASTAFNDYSNLSSVSIPNSVTSIGDGAFGECIGLTSITIPSSVTSIGLAAFLDCNKLTIVSIPNSVTSIGQSTFNGCSSLTSITIPNSVISIGYLAFLGCNGLTTVTIPNSVTSIGAQAFSGCNSLNSIDLPNSITRIGGGAFYDCTDLTAITCEASTPPILGSSVFENVDKSIPLYVPEESIGAYESADQWSDFTNIRAIPATSIYITANEDPQHAGTYYSTFYYSSGNYELPAAGVEAFVATVSGSDMNLTRLAGGAGVIPQGTAVILRSNIQNYTLTLSDDATAFNGDNDLRGVDDATNTPSNCYVLSAVDGVVGFYQYTGAQVGAHKAYVIYSGVQGSAPRRMRFVFDEENAATGVEGAQSTDRSANGVQKRIENGQLIIEANGVLYNAQGQMVK